MHFLCLISQVSYTILDLVGNIKIIFRLLQAVGIISSFSGLYQRYKKTFDLLLYPIISFTDSADVAFMIENIRGCSIDSLIFLIELI